MAIDDIDMNPLALLSMVALLPPPPPPQLLPPSLPPPPSLPWLPAAPVPGSQGLRREPRLHHAGAMAMCIPEAARMDHVASVAATTPRPLGQRVHSSSGNDMDMTQTIFTPTSLHTPPLLCSVEEALR